MNRRTSREEYSNEGLGDYEDESAEEETFAKRSVSNQAIVDAQVIRRIDDAIELKVFHWNLTLWASLRDEPNLKPGSRKHVFLACLLADYRVHESRRSLPEPGIIPVEDHERRFDVGYRIVGRVRGLYDWQLVPDRPRINLGFAVDVGFEVMCYLETEGRFGLGLDSWIVGYGAFIVSEATPEDIRELYRLESVPRWSWMTHHESRKGLRKS